MEDEKDKLIDLRPVQQTIPSCFCSVFCICSLNQLHASEHNVLCVLGFGHMTQQLMTVADRKLVLVLEGGYMLDSLSDCSEACLRALLNEKVCHCVGSTQLSS